MVSLVALRRIGRMGHIGRIRQMRRTHPAQLVAAAGLLLGLVGAAPPRVAAAPDGPVASRERGWPQWRGPRRDGVSDEKGLLPAWPAEGPKLLWQATGTGTGWSCPIVTRGRVFITGDVGDDLVIQALDPEGRRVWQAKNGAAWKGHYPGARACCAYADGRLYHMNAHGRVACLDAATGKEIWAVDILERFGAKNITWAMSECLLVDGRRLYVTPAGSKALMAALDTRDGKTVWVSEAIPGDHAVYTSPILFRFAGRRLLANCSSSSGFGVDADTGKILWRVPVETKHRATSASPCYSEGAVFYVAPDGPEGALYRLSAKGDGVEAVPAWKSPLDTLTGGVLKVGDFLFGSGYRRDLAWRCLDWRTGQERYRLTDLTKGAAVYADGGLYCLAEDGTAALLRPGETGFTVAGRFRLADAKPRDAWAHPVVLDGRLYLRYHDTLWCYDVKAR